MIKKCKDSIEAPHSKMRPDLVAPAYEYDGQPDLAQTETGIGQLAGKASVVVGHNRHIHDSVTWKLKDLCSHAVMHFPYWIIWPLPLGGQNSA